MIFPTRIKLLIWFAVLILFILIFSGIVIYRSTEKVLYTDLAHSLKEAAITTEFMLKKNYSNKLTPHDADSFRKELYDIISIDRNYSQIIIADSDKNVIARIREKKQTPLPMMIPYDIKQDRGNTKSKHVFDFSKEGIYFFRSIVINDKQYQVLAKKSDAFIINIVYNSEAITSKLDRIQFFLISGVVVIILISIGGGYLIARRSIKPINKITQFFNNFNSSKLDQRLEEPNKANKEVKELTTTFNEMLDRLQLSFNQLKQFSADAAHELKTPLTIIRGELEIALHEERSTEEYEAIITSALEEITRLSNVVETLLELSRADMGQVKMKKSKSDLSRHIMDVCDDVVILSESKNVQVEYNIEPGVELEYDSGRIHQAFLNIIDNAVKYTPSGGKIFINLKKNDNYAVIEVTDTGEGITESELPHIFDRFYRVKKKRSDEIHGTGLGLSIVKWIINAHNGKIDVKSTRNQGTTFTIKLPLN